MDGLGHSIVAWDEEAVLFFNAKEFHQRRVHEPTFKMVRELFAWGPQNAGYLKTAPGYDASVPVHVLGNPRIDMLRDELRDYYQPEVRRLKQRYGKFVIINSNFGKLNHAVSRYVVRPGGKDQSVGGAITPFMQRAWTHRMNVFESFKKLVPYLSSQLPDYNIIVRPHPAENHQTWRDVAKGLANVHVIHEGPVQNWLLAADAMIHNGCTTGIEAYLLGTPTISYQPFIDPELDFALSNDLGSKATTPQTVLAAINSFAHKPPKSASAKHKSEKLGLYFSSLQGKLATDLMAAQIANFAERDNAQGRRSAGIALRAHADSRVRALSKWVASLIPDHKNSTAYNLQRFPGVTLLEVDGKIAQFHNTLGRFNNVKARQFADNIFLISATLSKPL